MSEGTKQGGLAYTAEKTGPSFLGGAMIIAGTAVGAGMFSVPTVSAGMWSIWAIFALAFTWFCMLHSGMMILETNLNYPVGSSFDTMVKDTLGTGWNTINNIAVAFVGYILCYAYISGGGSIVVHTLEATVGVAPPQMLAGLMFAIGLALFVWWSTKAVDRITTVLIGGMIITFFMSVAGYTFNMKAAIFFDSESALGMGSYFPYLFAALPFCLASFGYHHNVPSLMKYYGKDPKKIVMCLGTGTLIALVLYIVWLFATLGNISRADFGPIIEQGGNIGVLVEALGQAVENTSASNMLSAFGNLAVASSFLGVALGLFDFLADFLKFDDSQTGRAKTAAVTFVPPLIGGIFFPDGFIMAIGYAGLAATVWTAIVPALMVRISRKKFGNPRFRVWGGEPLVWVIFSFGVLVAVSHALGMFNALPVYP
ncbi:Tryptophan-specific transport protein [Pseudovibrio axinellae]|uniref:Aromatic amino acid permease n=1 Tax=Pseudovibrio axinellae TaxID=989403 RepID=A0A165XNN5_9HYPH|nr:tryptophan permease [Pseudovibrio axinellae]KZL17893.1 Tryptophan-specific transport protein [Pseudovibrio axinellae]SER58691.1 tryptophan-specific transport protein [Pseudovibrio axinellae]